MKKTGLIFKFLIIIFIMISLNINICYAKEKDIKTGVVKEDDSITLKLFVKDDVNLYGFRGIFDYDAKVLSFDGCESDSFNTTLKNDILLLEGIKGYSNSIVATCKFSVISFKDNTIININDISISNGIKVIYNDNITTNIDLDGYYNDKETNEDESITSPSTSGAFIVIPFVLVVISASIILIINKKYNLFSYLIIFSIVFFPAISFAINTTKTTLSIFIL